jgi:hypothetical protein
MGAHINNQDEFQSDKYPTCPPGKVPLSVKDVTAQDLLWAYAQRRRVVDAEFADDLEAALAKAGYEPGPAVAGVVVIETDSETHLIPRSEVRHVSVEHADTSENKWVLTYTLANATPRVITFDGDRRPEAVKQSGVDAGWYNGITAGTLMRFLTRGAHDLRLVLRKDGQWDVKSPDGRWQ